MLGLNGDAAREAAGACPSGPLPGHVRQDRQLVTAGVVPGMAAEQRTEVTMR